MTSSNFMSVLGFRALEVYSSVWLNFLKQAKREVGIFTVIFRLKMRLKISGPRGVPIISCLSIFLKIAK